MQKVLILIALAVVLVIVVSDGNARDVVGRDWNVISAALRKLKVKQNLANGRVTFTVTRETIEFLKEHEGDEITIAGDSMIYFPGEKPIEERREPTR